MKRVLESDGYKTEIFHYDEATGETAIQTITNVEKILEANKRAFNDSDGRHRSEAFNRYASIVPEAADEWCKPRGISYREFMSNPEIIMLFLRDPDNAAWRTHTGKL